MSINALVYPIVILVFINLFYPFIFTLRSDDYMFSLPLPFIMGIYIASFFLFGYTIYLGDMIGNNDIYYLAIFLVISNILWGLTFNTDSNMTMVFLFVSLLLGYIIYNEIFLSSLTDDGTTLYLNLYSTYIIFTGFMIAVAIEKFRDSPNYELLDRRYKKGMRGRLFLRRN
jgi:hypothetical protein